MATYKFVNKTQLDYDLERIADAIRSKSGTSSNLTFPSGMVSAIRNFSSTSIGSWSAATRQVASGAPNYQLVDGDILDGYITQVANAIREVCGLSSYEKLSFPNGMIGVINAISTAEQETEWISGGRYKITGCYMKGGFTAEVTGYLEYNYYGNSVTGYFTKMILSEDGMYLDLYNCDGAVIAGFNQGAWDYDNKSYVTLDSQYVTPTFKDWSEVNLAIPENI